MASVFRAKPGNPLLLLHIVMQITIRVHKKLQQISSYIQVRKILKNHDFPIPYNAKYNCLYLENLPGNLYFYYHSMNIDETYNKK